MVSNILLITEVVAGIFLSVICVIVFVAVGDRFVLGLGISWPEELARFLLVWCSMLSASVVLGKKIHYTVYYFVEKCIQKEGKVGRLLALIIYVWLCVILFVLLIKGTELTIAMHQTVSATMRIPKSFVYSAIPINSLVMIIILLPEICSLAKELFERGSW